MPHASHRTNNRFRAGAIRGTVGARLIKIGTTTRASHRVPMQNGWDGLLVLYPGSYDEEAAELVRFRQHVVRGNEYHAPHGDLFDRVDEIRQGYGLSPVSRWGIGR